MFLNLYLQFNSMAKILILFAHPRYENSLVQQRLSKAAQEVRGVTFHDLYEHYPDFDVEIDHEQELLISHDMIILQHPFYWYSCPPLLKQWIDLVLEHGWAYGKEGNSLKGKIMFNAISTGGRKDAYVAGGFNRFTIAQFLVPFEQTARLCNIEYYPPFVIHGTHKATKDDIERAGASYKKLLEGLVSDQIKDSTIRKLTYLNELTDLKNGS
jgi:glutathione-regulated potassium-efflux system ancillary protein KefG